MDLLGRTLMTINCTDAETIRKVSDAGTIIETPDGPVQIMHNGLKVAAGGYLRRLDGTRHTCSTGTS